MPSFRSVPPVGYNSAAHDADSPDLWSVWRFDPTDRSDPSLVLLSQDAPIVIRTLVTATDLAQSEREFLEQAVEATRFESSIGGSRAASGRVIERILVGAPLYDTRVLVASPSPIGPAVLTAIGWSISPPQDRDTQGLLSGGFEIVHEPTDVADTWTSLDVGSR